jgi:hypothetical protein
MTGRWNTQRGEQRTFDEGAQSRAINLATVTTSNLTRRDAKDCSEQFGDIAGRLGKKFFKNSKKRRA